MNIVGFVGGNNELGIVGVAMPWCGAADGTVLVLLVLVLLM